jgi:hypothetical protein
VDSFYTLSVDKDRHFLTSSPLILSKYLLNGPLLEISQPLTGKIYRDPRNLYEIVPCFGARGGGSGRGLVYVYLVRASAAGPRH